MTDRLDAAIDKLLQHQLLAEPLIKFICEKVKEILVKESNVISINSPVTVVGDIHGQFDDLLEIFKISGYVPDTNYLFLGDYVDRGLCSVETISLLFCLKVRYPNRIYLIRGNHESRYISRNYGFFDECLKKYKTPLVWQYFTDAFDFLSLSVIIDNSIFCVHGGLSPFVQSIDQIRIIDRFREIPHEGPMADLLWSDPNPESKHFALSPRGAGYTFGSNVLKRFLHLNNATCMLRAHQLCQSGYQTLFDGLLSTIWSAPNYCYRCANDASVLQIGENGEQYFNVFYASPEQGSYYSCTTMYRDGLYPEYFL